MPFELQDSTALVTGATGGIGQAIVRALHARGAKVIASGRKRDVLEDLARRARPGRAAGRGPRGSGAGRRAWSTDAASTCWSPTPRCLRRAGSTASPRRRSTGRWTSTCARRCSSRGRSCRGMLERGAGHLVFISSLSGKGRERRRLRLQRDQVRPARVRLRARTRSCAARGVGVDHGLPRLHPRGGHVRRQRREAAPRRRHAHAGRRGERRDRGASRRTAPRSTWRRSRSPSGARAVRRSRPALMAGVNRRLGSDPLADAIAEGQRDKR